MQQTNIKQFHKSIKKAFYFAEICRYATVSIFCPTKNDVKMYLHIKKIKKRVE